MLKQITEDLCCLCTAAGVGGQKDIERTAVDLLTPLTDSVKVDTMGNVLAVRRCADENAPTVMLEAHMDEVGFLVTYIDDKGFLHVDGAGHADERVLAAQPVVVYAEHSYNGVFCSVPPHLAKDENAAPKLSNLAIDVGLSADEARRLIPLGTRVGFAPQFTMLNDRLVCSKALDNRAGMAAILHCLRRLPQDIPVHVAVAFCVQEELGCRGCAPAVRLLQPSAALVTDVSFAHTPDANPHQCGELSKGVMIGISPILQKELCDKLFALAQKADIPYQTEVMAGSTGTDADNISKAERGVPTGLLSIPQRFMHTPVELVDIADVAAVGNLMAAYITQGGAAE